MSKVFISYSHKDEVWKDRVASQLGVLAQEGRLDVWEDRRIDAGDDWFPEIETAIQTCHVALLLISADFLNSKFILNEEVARFLERRIKDGVRVIPLIVRPCLWQQVSWLKGIQARPKDGKPLTSMSENAAEEALAALAEELLELLGPSDLAVQQTVSQFVRPDKISLAKLPQTDREFLGREPELRLPDDAWTDTTGPSPSKPVFICYAHRDNEGSDASNRWLDRLQEHLAPLVQEESITVCSDQDIELGDDWHAHIQKQLHGARAAVLLVSPAFLASKYIRNSELPVLLRNAREHGVKIIPVVLRPCLFAETRFKYPYPKSGPQEFTLASLQAVGSPSKALSEMTEGEQDRALLKVAQTVAKLQAGHLEFRPLDDAGPRGSQAPPADAVFGERAVARDTCKRLTRTTAKACDALLDSPSRQTWDALNEQFEPLFKFSQTQAHLLDAAMQEQLLRGVDSLGELLEETVLGVDPADLGWREKAHRFLDAAERIGGA